MRKGVVSLLIGVILVLPFLIWYRQTGNLTIYFSGEALEGQLPYILSKLAALYALTFVNLQIIAVLISKLGGRFPMRIHLALGVSIAVLSLSHFLLFVLAVSIRQSGFASGLFTFNLTDFYHTYLSIGFASLILMGLVVALGFMRAASRRAVFHHMHRLYFLVIVGIYVHSLAVGSELQSDYGIYYFSALALLIILLIGMVTSQAIRRRASYA